MNKKKFGDYQGNHLRLITYLMLLIYYINDGFIIY
jgi:hypothetical protein